MKNQSVRWLLAELLVIVLGILIAFQVDEWRSYLAERRAEEVALSGILRDLELDREVFDLREERYKSRIDSIGNLIAHLNGSEERDPLLIAQLFQDIGLRSRGGLNTATYSGLVQEGRLSIIRSESVRRQIQHYYDRRLFIFDAINEGAENLGSDFGNTALDDMFYGMKAVDSDRVLVVDTDPEFDASSATSRRILGEIGLVLPLDEIPRNPRFIASLSRYGAVSDDVIDHLILARTDNENLQEQIRTYLETL